MSKYILMSLYLLASLNVTTLAQNKKSNMPKMMMAMSREDRDKMATAHEQMASRLRSDKEMSACRSALQVQCKSLMGGMCGMMSMNTEKSDGNAQGQAPQ